MSLSFGAFKTLKTYMVPQAAAMSAFILNLGEFFYKSNFLKLDLKHLHDKGTLPFVFLYCPVVCGTYLSTKNAIINIRHLRHVIECVREGMESREQIGKTDG